MALENLRKTGIKYLLGRLKDYFVQIKDAVKTVNQTEPDQYGDIKITRVDFAGDLESSASRTSIDTYIQRTTGGAASIKDEGDAWLASVLGSCRHDDYVAEVIDLNVYPVDPTSENAITATVSASDFRTAATGGSGEYTFLFTTSWDTDPSTYGITVSGTPAAGDQIVVEYTAEELGTIVVGTPTAYVSTGWNLYKHSDGYAKVVKYSDEYGYGIAGSQTLLQFSETLTGTKSAITVSDGTFSVPSDGYVWVTGGDSSTTAIWATWSDWQSGYAWANNQQGAWEGYSATTIDLSGLFGEGNPFPYGLCQVGTARDEINVSVGQAIRRIDRMANTSENLTTAQSSGRDYIVDENYIYIVLASPVTTSINVDGSYTANNHGLEYFTGTDVELTTYTLYGENLKNKLERDVVTISQQSLTTSEQAQVRTNIGAASASDISSIGTIKSFSLTSSQKLLTVADDDVICPVGVSIINLANGDSSDLPSSNYKYGKAIVEKYGTHRIFVTVHSIIDSTNVAFNRMDSSNAWLGWRTVVDNSNVYNALDKTASGFVLDARQGKKLMDRTIANSIVTRSLGTASGTSASVNTYSSRKFSDYWMLGFFMYGSSSDSIIRDVKWIDSSHWSSSSVVQTIANHGVNLANVSGIQFTYNSDTAVTVITIGAGSLTNFEIIGLLKE